MKRGRIFGITLAFLSLIAGLLVFSSSAETDQRLAIASKNISYDNDLKFVVAVPKASVTDSLTFTIAADGESYSVTTAVADLMDDAIKDPTVGGVECYAIMSDLGVAFKDISKVYTLTVSSGGETSEPMTYSVAEYLLERLFKNGIALAEQGTPDADRRKLYLTTLEMGADAEEVLYNSNANADDDVATLATEYFYSNVTGEAMLYKPGDKVILTSSVEVDCYQKTSDGWIKTAMTLPVGEVEVNAHMILSRGE